MTPIGPAPFVRILLALHAAGAGVDYVDRAAAPSPVTVRLSRNRSAPVRSERPSVTLIYVDDSPRPDDRHLNQFEQARVFTFDAQVDANLDPEDSGLDPTGFALLTRILAAFAEALVSSPDDPNHPVYLGGLVDTISVGEYDPSERSTPDEGRLTLAFSVVYRVRSDDANVLLSMGDDQ